MLADNTRVVVDNLSNNINNMLVRYFSPLTRIALRTVQASAATTLCILGIIISCLKIVNFSF